MPGSRSPASGSTEIAAVRRGPFSNPGILLLVALAVLVSAYALGYLPQFGVPFGHIFNEAVLSSQHAGLTELNPAVYGVAALIAFLILLAVLRFVDIFLRKVSGKDTFAARPTKSIEQFVEESEAIQISQRVARESYHLLFNHYPHRMSVELEDNLRLDLGLVGEDIRTLRSGLLDRAGRTERPNFDPALIVTVRDLLAYAEAAPELRKDRSGSRSRATDDIREMSEYLGDPNSRPLTESRIRTREHIANLQRRAADYSGPRRRATDNRIDPDYVGPHRRSTDRSAAVPPTSPSTISPSAPVDAAAAQKADHPVAQTAAELNQLDPLFVPPRNKRTPTPSQS